MNRGIATLRCAFLAALLLLALSGTARAWDREAAKDYAQEYALSHNPNFAYISGADCANFVSQSIWGGDIVSYDWDLNGGSDWTIDHVDRTQCTFHLRLRLAG